MTSSQSSRDMLSPKQNEDIETTFNLLNHGGIQWFWKSPLGLSGGRVTTGAGANRLVNAAILANANLYLTLNPSRPAGIRVRRKDVLAWKYILIDVDPLGERIENPSEAAGYLANIVESMLGKVAGTFVDSGRGVQLWLKLSPNEMPKNCERAASGFLNALGREWGNRHKSIIDVCTSDLPRIARFPGSMNWKSQRISSIIWTTEGDVNFKKVLDFMPPPMIESSPPKNPINYNDLGHLLPHLTFKARMFLMNGVSSPGRHAAAFATAKCLQEIGMPEDVARGWIIAGGELCYKWNLERLVWVPYPLSPSECYRIVKGVYQNGL
jgi:hypothetical protein